MAHFYGTPVPDVVGVTLVTDTNAYASADVLVVPQEVTGFFRVKGGTSVLRQVVVLDEALQSQSFDLVFMNANGSLGTINAGVGPTDAVAATILAQVSIITTDYVSLANSSVATKTGLYVPMQAADGSTSLWLGAVCRSGTPTYAASSLKLKLGIDRY